MTFKVRYEYKPHTWENGKYTDNDRYVVSIKDLDITVTEDELYELKSEIKRAIYERNDVRGYHE